MWRESDRSWAAEQGVDLQELSEQLQRLQAGDETLRIDRPATLGDGIHPLDPASFDDRALPTHRVSTFIPASGAATRMFAALVKAHEAGIDTLVALDRAIEAGRDDLLPCRQAYVQRTGLAIGRDLGDQDLGQVLHRWLVDDLLHTRPKGLIPLHRYDTHDRTAVVEHLLEAAAVGCTSVHFTVPAGREAEVLAECQRAAERMQRDLPAVDCSVQHPSTDTVAATPDGQIFRTEHGTPLLRPGGHGALLRNLERLGADLVLVKNVDNVTRDETREAVVRWRRAILAELVRLERQVHDHLAALEDPRSAEQALAFAATTFGRRGHGSTLREQVTDALHRPIRVVGVVRNEGQPGGGPFWVREQDGTATLQIMESAQIDRSDKEQAALFAAATHFNPVDMALSLRAPNGRPYDLAALVDDRGWLRATKTHRGQPLRALERPGLWNGAMAGWNTRFVEIPAWTFRPVKQLHDLLGEGHRQPPV